MTLKRSITLIVVLLLICGAFAVGRFWTGLNKAVNELECLVYSDTEVRKQLLSFWHIPEKSYRLYYAHCGFQDADEFIAFSASEADCLSYLDSLNGISPEEMELTAELPDWIFKRSPKRHQRPDLDHSNWDLRSKHEYLYKMSVFGLVIYDKDINRIYICESG